MRPVPQRPPLPAPPPAPLATNRPKPSRRYREAHSPRKSKNQPEGSTRIQVLPALARSERGDRGGRTCQLRQEFDSETPAASACCKLIRETCILLLQDVLIWSKFYNQYVAAGPAKRRVPSATCICRVGKPIQVQGGSKLCRFANARSRSAH